MASPSLLGPPELYNQTRQQQQTQNTTINDPFMGLMVNDFNKTRVVPPPPETNITENNAQTYFSSGNPCLDLFFHVVPDTPSHSLEGRLQSAWTHNSLTTLKLVFNLRGERGTGKSNKEGFYSSVSWLHENHPKTLACNIQYLVEFGYVKDLPEIVYRVLEGFDVRERQKREWNERKNGEKKGRKGPQAPFQRNKPSKKRSCRYKAKNKKFKKPSATREIRILNAMERAKIEKETARIARKEKRVEMAKRAIERYSHDPEYRYLHERVSDFFAERLKLDMQHLNCGNKEKVSLVAKWCPSLDSSYDRSTLLCERIAKKVFPKESYPEYEGIEEAHYVYRVRDRLRKEVLVPLRKVLGNKAKKAAGKGTLLPHEIIEASLNQDSKVAERQWKRMVDDLLKKGKLKNCLAICDVSHKMHGKPMEAALALGLLVSELSEEPWKGKLVTFSANPKLQFVQGDSLLEKTQFVRQMQWGLLKWGENPDFQKVFDLILEVAVKGKLKQDQMIKRVFVFSDMEFDKSNARPYETDYDAIVRKFTDKGYKNVIPEIVFWNLRNSKATPVPGTQMGVALVSGFSSNLMKLFLDGDVDISPESIMEAAISGDEYQNFVVLD